MAFTPLVSPAVTPLEAHFNIPEYTIPGAYFSPLNSPALQAQQSQHGAVYDQRAADNTNSPIDMNLDSHSAPASSHILPRKSSKRSLPKPRNTRGVRQSPIVKPRTRRTARYRLSICLIWHRPPCHFLDLLAGLHTFGRKRQEQ
jgi:hypothetical protein